MPRVSSVFAIAGASALVAAACGGEGDVAFPASAGGGGAAASSVSSSVSATGTGGAVVSSSSSVASSSTASSGGAAPSGCEALMPPDGAPTDCSQNSNTQATFMVESGCTSMTLEVFWVDFDCAEMSFGTVSPGGTFSISSFETHPWRLRNAATGDLILDVGPLNGATTIVVP